MKIDCLLAGVGGQGTVLASRLLAQAALEHGAFARTSETIGMAQRGGCVVSHVRIGSRGCAPVIPKAHADLLLGFEPAEAVRNIAYLRAGGTIVLNTQPIMPVTASLGGAEYAVEKMLEYVKNSGHRAVFVDGTALCARVGSAKVLNVIMLGVLVAEGLLPFSKEQLLTTMHKNIPAKFAALNERAFAIGCAHRTLGEDDQR